MKKIFIFFVIAVVLMGSSALFGAESKKPAATVAKPAGKTVFNRLSDFFSTFDRPFTRPKNKEGFCNATANWIKNIDKE